MWFTLWLTVGHNVGLHTPSSSLFLLVVMYKQHCCETVQCMLQYLCNMHLNSHNNVLVDCKTSTSTHNVKKWLGCNWVGGWVSQLAGVAWYLTWEVGTPLGRQKGNHGKHLLGDKAKQHGKWIDTSDNG